MSENAKSLLVLLEPPDDGRGPSGPAVVTEALRLARVLGATLHAFTWPEGADADLDALAKVAADAATRLRPITVILADTDTGRQLGPMIAHSLGSGCVTGCSDVLVREVPSPADRLGCEDGGGPGVGRTLAFVKPVYGGWLEQEIEPLQGTTPVVTLDLTGAAVPVDQVDSLPTPETLEVHLAPEPRVRRLEVTPPDPRSVDLVHARRIVTAGAGSATDDLLAAVSELAELLEGSVGATRPVVDDGHLPKERLIGQTGRTVSPDLYLGLGLSGSPHHVAGVRGAERIFAINKDPHAPIFQFSDIGYVADLEVLLPALVNKIKEWRDAPGSPDRSR